MWLFTGDHKGRPYKVIPVKTGIGDDVGCGACRSYLFSFLKEVFTMSAIMTPIRLKERMIIAQTKVTLSVMVFF